MLRPHITTCPSLVKINTAYRRLSLKLHYFQAEVVFLFCFRKLQALNTQIADSLLHHLEERYKQRRNEKIISMVKFLSDPKGYLPGDGFLEMDDLRKVVKETCERLFPQGENHSAQPALKEEKEDPDEPREEPELSYNQKLNKQFDALLDQLGAVTHQAATQLQHIEEEMALASKTGELTAKLAKLHQGVLSIPASSIESERAFSIATRFVTKIRSRLGDVTLDNFAFAKSKLKNDNLKLVRFLLCLVLSFFSHQNQCSRSVTLRYGCGERFFLKFLLIPIGTFASVLNT